MQDLADRLHLRYLHRVDLLYEPLPLAMIVPGRAFERTLAFPRHRHQQVQVLLLRAFPCDSHSQRYPLRTSVLSSRSLMRKTRGFISTGENSLQWIEQGGVSYA